MILAPMSEVPDGIVIFDDVCVLCYTWFRFVAAWDPRVQFRFAPIQRSYVRSFGAVRIDPLPYAADGLVPSLPALDVSPAPVDGRITRPGRLVRYPGCLTSDANVE